MHPAHGMPMSGRALARRATADELKQACISRQAVGGPQDTQRASRRPPPANLCCWPQAMARQVCRG